MNKKFVVCLGYLMSIVVANLSATHFGIWSTPINAFVLIGLEMATRDYLHVNLNRLWLLVIVFAGGILSYMINQDAQNIALASCVAVMLSCTVDYFIFNKVSGTWFKKSNVSNVGSSISDSIVFPVIAFGVLSPVVILLHIFMKLSGGFIWSNIINKCFIKDKTDCF